MCTPNSSDDRGVPAPRPGGVLSRSPAFAALFTARALSLLGDGVGNLTLIVHVQQTTGTGAAVGLLLMVVSLPSVLSPLLGVAADRVDQRHVLAAGEVAQGLVVGVAAVWLPPLPVLLALLLVKATIASIVEPAGRSAIPSLVADDDLPAANALIGGLRQAGEVGGPILGGQLVAAAGVRAGLAVDALTFAVSLPLLLRIPPLPPETDAGGVSGTTVAASAREGLAYTLGQPVTRAVAVGLVLAGLSAADDVALPFLAAGLGAGERGVGALYSAVGAGLVAGYALTARLSRLPPVNGFVLGGCVAALGNVFTASAPALLAAITFQAVRGLGIAAFEIGLQTMVQRAVPRRLQGRVFANVYGGVNVAAVAALLVGGPLVDATSPRAVLLASGAVGLVGVVLSRAMLRRPSTGRAANPRSSRRVRVWVSARWRTWWR